jgi:hypothetical protein
LVSKISNYVFKCFEISFLLTLRLNNILLKGAEEKGEDRGIGRGTLKMIDSSSLCNVGSELGSELGLEFDPRTEKEISNGPSPASGLNRKPSKISGVLATAGLPWWLKAINPNPNFNPNLNKGIRVIPNPSLIPIQNPNRLGLSKIRKRLLSRTRKLS